MPRSTRLAVILMIGAVTACAEDAAAPTAPAGTPSFAAQAGGDTPVTTTVADADLTIAPELQIRSDGLGAYVNSSKLSSVIQGSGAWVLDSYYPHNATRKIFLEFSLPIAGSGPGGGAPVAVPSGLYKVRAISRCNLLGTSFLTLAPGASMPCPLHVAFDYNGVSYAVQMNPGPSGVDPAPETNYATITCVTPSSGSGPCTAWTITPSGAGGQNVARLIKYVVVSKNTTRPVNQGDFYFSFRIGVTNP